MCRFKEFSLVVSCGFSHICIMNFESDELLKFPTFHTKQSEDMESLALKLRFLHTQEYYLLIVIHKWAIS